MGLYRPDLGTELAVISVEEALRGKRRDLGGRMFEGGLILTLIVSLGILLALLAEVFAKGWGVFADRGVGFLTSSLSADPARAGVGQALAGSLGILVFVVVVAFPLGIGAAIYLEEYARDTRLTRFITATVRNLAGVPSIVYGLLGLAIFVLALRGITGPGGGELGLSLVSGGLTMAILVLPIVVITAAEALRAVPLSIREAGYAVGATQWEVIRSHVLPYAAPGILTGTVLSLARAFGETAPLLLVGAVTGFFFQSGGGFLARLQGPYTALPTTIYNWARLPGEDFARLAAAAIVVLMVLILLVNSGAIVLRNRYERRW
jgi:phosphate transport system permease protein